MASEGSRTADETVAKTLRVALIGHRNVGKSTLFGLLTGIRQKTGNYPGVTVERRTGTLRHGDLRLEIQDLPGTNSLVPKSLDESIVTESLLGEAAPDRIVVVSDATQLRRGLYLLTQVLDFGIPTVFCCNMVDEAHAEGLAFDADALQSALGGLPVVMASAAKGEGKEALLTAITREPHSEPASQAVPFTHIAGLPEPSAWRWRALRDLDSDESLVRREADARFAQVESWLDRAGLGQAEATRLRSDRIDRVLLHQVFGPLVFLAVMALVFQSVFTVAQPFAEAIESGFGALQAFVQDLLPEGLLSQLLVDGILAGVGGVLVFLPQIAILFLLLGLLEDSGYLMRAALIADAPLRRMGLSGRSFIPLLSSYACAIPGILATRTIADKKERHIAIGVAPLLTCSARLPVYSLLIANFIPDTPVLFVFDLRALTMLGLYVFGTLLAAVAAFVMHRMMRGAKSPLILELPPYRAPRLMPTLLSLKDRALAFVKNAGTVILAMSVLIWALLSFPAAEPTGKDGAAPDRAIEASFGGQLGHAVEPLIAPLGFDWRIGIGLLGSLAAREVFVATMAVTYAVEEDEAATEEATDARISAAFAAARHDRTGAPVYDLPTVLALLVFFAVSLQCVSTIGLVWRETRSFRFAAIQFVTLTGLAYALAWLTRMIALSY